MQGRLGSGGEGQGGESAGQVCAFAAADWGLLEHGAVRGSRLGAQNADPRGGEASVRQWEGPPAPGQQRTGSAEWGPGEGTAPRQGWELYPTGMTWEGDTWCL